MTKKAKTDLKLIETGISFINTTYGLVRPMNQLIIHLVKIKQYQTVVNRTKDQDFIDIFYLFYLLTYSRF